MISFLSDQTNLFKKFFGKRAGPKAERSKALQLSAGCLSLLHGFRFQFDACEKVVSDLVTDNVFP